MNGNAQKDKKVNMVFSNQRVNGTRPESVKLIKKYNFGLFLDTITYQIVSMQTSKRQFFLLRLSIVFLVDGDKTDGYSYENLKPFSPNYDNQRRDSINREPLFQEGQHANQQWKDRKNVMNQVWSSSPDSFKDNERALNTQANKINNYGTFTMKKHRYVTAGTANSKSDWKGAMKEERKNTEDDETKRRPADELRELKKKISETTKEILALYKSPISSEGIPRNNEQQGKPFVAQSKSDLIKKLGKTHQSIENLKNRLKIEGEVRRQMIRYLAREKLENKMKSKALDALLEYFHPNNSVLQDINVSDNVKRVIIKERISMLSKQKKHEFEKRLKSLKKSN